MAQHLTTQIFIPSPTLSLHQAGGGGAIPTKANGAGTGKNNGIKHRWLATCSRPNPALTRNVVVAKRFLELVDIHFRQKRSIVFYADNLHITGDYLRQICQKALAYNPSHCIGLRIVMEATGLLDHELDLTIKEIAYLMGFEDPDYFSKFFKKYMDVSPKAYRMSKGFY